jgi:hypothetical protein
MFDSTSFTLPSTPVGCGVDGVDVVASSGQHRDDQCHNLTVPSAEHVSRHWRWHCATDVEMMDKVSAILHQRHTFTVPAMMMDEGLANAADQRHTLTVPSTEHVSRQLSLGCAATPHTTESCAWKLCTSSASISSQ